MKRLAGHDLAADHERAAAPEHVPQPEHVVAVQYAPGADPEHLRAHYPGRLLGALRRLQHAEG